MANFFKILKIVKGFFPIVFLAVGIFAGTQGNDNQDNSKAPLKQPSGLGVKEVGHSADSLIENKESPQAVCGDALADILEEDENGLALNSSKVVECMSVGCGGIF